MAPLDHGVVPIPNPTQEKATPLVDRVEEMNVLKDALYRAIHGQGSLVLIYGEAGIGKTRLAKELAAYASLIGIRVLSGKCPALLRMDGVPPYILWKEVIKDYLETCTPEQLYRVIGYYPAEIAKLVPEFGQKTRTIPQSLPISPETEQNRLFEAVSQLITNISMETPLLVVLDDLQWADPSSVLLLLYLARDVQKRSLLLLGAYRSIDIDSEHSLTPVLNELKREHLLKSICLKRVSVEDTSEIIKQILKQDDIPKEFCETIYEKTRGNAFFIEEVVEALKEEEIIYQEGAKWKIRQISKIEFPETVKSLIKTRIGHLDDECRHVLTMASFIGNEFTFETLLEVVNSNDDRLRKIVDGLIRAGLFKHTNVHGEDVCSFADMILKDVVYEDVGTFERKKLHRIVGTSLEKAYKGKSEEHLGELALHYLEGGDREKALEYFLKAANKAAKIHANSEVISYLLYALDLLGQNETEIQEKANVLEMLGDVKRIVGEYETCIEFWNRALLLREQLCEKERVARLHRKMAVTLWREMGNIRQAQQNFEKALNLLGTEPENIELATLYAAKARASYFTEDVTKARSWAERALELGKKLNASEVIASAYIDLGLVLDAEGETNEAVECMEKALKIALEKGYVDVAGRAYNNLAVRLQHLGENQQRLECYEKGFELAKKVGHIELISWFGSQLALRYFSMGNINHALTLCEESEALARKTGNLFNLSESTFILGTFYHVLGEWNKDEEYLRESIGISNRINVSQSISSSYEGLGWSYYDKGEYAKAKECFDRMFEVSEKTGAKTDLMYSYQWPAMNYIELGEIDKARTLLDDLREFAEKKQNKQLVADEHATRAMLFRAEKKWAESVDLFEKSLKEYETLGARQFNVYYFAKLILVEYARVALERNNEDDKEKAHSLLSQALEIFRKMDARKDIEKTEEKLVRIEGGQLVFSKPKPVSHVSSGYEALDRLLYGGIPQGYAVILTSPPCDERDSLTRLFLETGARRSEVTFFVTINPSAVKILAEKFPSKFYFFVCNPEANAITKDLPNVFTLKGVENLTNVSIALTSAIRQLNPSPKGPRRICLDLVSDVLLQHRAVETRRWLSALVTKLKSEDFTTLAVVDPRMHPPEELCAILGLFEGEISLCEREKEKGLEKSLRIKKMSNRKYLEDELLLEKEQL